MTGDSATAKQRLRDRLRASRRAWSDGVGDEGRRLRAERLAASVLSDPRVATACAEARAVTCYVSLPVEPPSDLLLDALAAAGARVLLPIIRPDRALEWGWYTEPARLVPAVWGILEPSDDPAADSPEGLAALLPSVLLVPALAVDVTGARLGQGGGYYDTLLAAARTWAHPPAVLAIVGPDEVLPAGSIPVVGHDQRVDGWITG